MEHAPIGEPVIQFNAPRTKSLKPGVADKKSYAENDLYPNIGPTGARHL